MQQLCSNVAYTEVVHVACRADGDDVRVLVEDLERYRTAILLFIHRIKSLFPLCVHFAYGFLKASMSHSPPIFAEME